MSLLCMAGRDLRGKRVLIREDFNVPMLNGKITSTRRIEAALPTIKMALDKGAAVILMSHLGRPQPGQFDPQFSLQPVAEFLSRVLKKNVKLINDWNTKVLPGHVALFENVRFLLGEAENKESLAKQMASLCDVFVMDAFATAHRKQASTVGVASFAPIACAGPLLEAELHALQRVTEYAESPQIAIVGGSKVSTKLGLLRSLLQRVDSLIVGGGIANTLLLASGHAIGQSLHEPDLLEEAKSLLAQAKPKQIPLPVDVVVAKQLAPQVVDTAIKSVEHVADDDLILDIGPKTIALYTQLLATAKTIIWNGPVGVFEYPAFAAGTQAIAHAVADSEGFSMAGGGDTLAALEQYQLEHAISYISTGGGAFLNYLADKTLPVIAVLEQRAQELACC
jgi:phosphoglycerate kinase